MSESYDDPNRFGWLQAAVLLALTLIIVYGLVFGCDPRDEPQPGPSVSPSLQWGRQSPEVTS